MYNSLVIRNSYLAEVNLSQTPANSQRVNFLDIPELAQVYTVGIEAFTSTQLTKSPNGATLVSAAGLTGIALTLAVKGTERFIQIPGYTLVSSLNGGVIREYDRLMFTLNKSYITIFDSTSLAVSQSICFNFYYNKKLN